MTERILLSELFDPYESNPTSSSVRPYAQVQVTEVVALRLTNLSLHRITQPSKRFLL